MTHAVSSQESLASQEEARSVDVLMPIVYEQLASLAAGYLRRETNDMLLEPSVLVNEVYLRLAGGSCDGWASEEDFFRVAASAMRKVLIDHARRRRSLKRGYGRTQVAIEFATTTGSRDVDIREVDEALESLADLNERGCRIIELRFFAGLTLEHIARVLGVSRKTVVQDWGRARQWLAEALADKGEPTVVTE